MLAKHHVETNRLLKAIQHGLSNRWKRRYLPQAPSCPRLFVPGDGIPIASISIAIFIHLGGVLLSILWLIFERIKDCKSQITRRVSALPQ